MIDWKAIELGSLEEVLKGVVTVSDTGTLLGQYANHFRIGSNAVEFIVDFGQFYRDHGEPRYHTRIITNPRYAKELLSVLTNSVSDYENDFGPIGDES